MSKIDNPSSAPPERLKVTVIDDGVLAPDFAADVDAGLSDQPKHLPSLYFYDEAGSLLFEEICRLPEYYPTRCEQEILLQHARELPELTCEELSLVELGSGSSSKTRILIEAFLAKWGGLHYLPIDISQSMLVASSERLLENYEQLRISAYCAEYNAGLHAISERELACKLVAFLGSNIGNLQPHEAIQFLGKIREDLSVGDYLLIGADLHKDRSIVELAYNDAQGVTAKFNKNLLRRINRELEGEFDLELFDHLAFFNPAYDRIEMHLKSRREQQVRIGALNRSFKFAPGEAIHTENSYKYSFRQLGQIFEQASLALRQRRLDSKGYFSLNLLEPV